MGWAGSSNALLHVNFLKSKAGEQCADAGARVLPGFVEDPVGERGLSELLLGGEADLRFEVGIGRDQKARCPRINAGAAVVDARREDLRLRQADGYRCSADRYITWLELAEIDAGNDFAVGNEHKFVAHQEAGEIGVITIAFHDLVDGVIDGFEAGELANLFDHRGRGNIDAGLAAGHDAGDAIPKAGMSNVAAHRKQQVAEESSQNEGAERKSLAAAGVGRRRNWGRIVGAHT